ncbi:MULTISPECIES: hypothetical protein [Cytobacillus]|uniref:hypothetical protein n=1 Tax=Cytobacillus TaxID=2675230 RepID=UPI002040C15A|nr:hypothetical protein [Cytobacillus firmus]MCM3705841.1 hypothetical protein [Cytobacillus firmus]
MEIYLTKDHRENKAGHIYRYDDKDANKLLEEGAGVRVDFPTVQSYAQNIDRLVAEYKQKRREIAESERYNDNESERKFQLAELKKNLDDSVKAAKENYAVEIEVLYRQHAAEAFNFNFDESANKFVDSVKTQFAIAGDKNALADMLSARLKSATTEEKAALSLALNDIKANIPADKLPQIEKSLKGAAPGSEAMLKCAILNELKANRNPAIAYDQLLIVSQRSGK